jgi:hypothetical protein
LLSHRTEPLHAVVSSASVHQKNVAASEIAINYRLKSLDISPN